MKTMFFLLACMLSACQSWQAHGPDQKSPSSHRGPGTGAGASGAMGTGTSSGPGDGAAMAGRRDMCALSQRIADARTPEERQAIVEQAMPDMPQESRERHIQMMQQRCQ